MNLSPSREAVQAGLDVLLRSTAQDDEEARADVLHMGIAMYAIDLAPLVDALENAIKEWEFRYGDGSATRWRAVLARSQEPQNG